MLGEIIQARMKEMDVDDKWLIGKTGLSRSTVERITSGKRESFSTASLARVCYVLELSTDEVLSEANMILGGRRYKDTLDTNERLKREIAELKSELDQARTEIDVLRLKIAEDAVRYAKIEATNELLEVKLELKDQIIKIHEHYSDRG
jgi:DNA-binding Xre family transcriptional regulator